MFPFPYIERTPITTHLCVCPTFYLMCYSFFCSTCSWIISSWKILIFISLKPIIVPDYIAHYYIVWLISIFIKSHFYPCNNSVRLAVYVTDWMPLLQKDLSLCSYEGSWGIRDILFLLVVPASTMTLGSDSWNRCFLYSLGCCSFSVYFLYFLL